VDGERARACYRGGVVMLRLTTLAS